MEGDEVKEQIPQIQASNIRLADFWDSSPEAWLAFAKSQCRRAGIKSELVKFDAVVEKLPLSLITKLTCLIAKPPKEEPCAKLCSELIKLASLSDIEKYQTLMQSLEIADSRPSDLYQRMKQLLSHENPDTFIFRQMLLLKLPPDIQQIIAVISSPDAPMDQFVEKADKAYEIHSNYQTISTISSLPAPVHSPAPPSSQLIEVRFTLVERKINELCSEIQHLRSRERPRSRKKHSIS